MCVLPSTEIGGLFAFSCVDCAVSKPHTFIPAPEALPALGCAWTCVHEVRQRRTALSAFLCGMDKPAAPGAERVVITFGTFDLFHFGHLRVLERAAALGTRLVVGVSSDALNFAKKGRYPVICEAERYAIVASLSFVHTVFMEESLELKREYVKRHGAHVLVMGDDWEGRFDHLRDVCDVVYLRRTEGISTTEIIEKISATFGSVARPA